MKNSKLTAVILGAIGMVATVLIYLIAFDGLFDEPIRWVSLLMLLIAEAVGTLKAVFARQNLISQTALGVSLAHILLVILLSVIFAVAFEDSIKTYVLLNVLILCGVAGVDVLILFFSKKVSADNKRLAGAQSVMHACGARAEGLAVVYGQHECKKDLVEIAEMIKYSDNSELTGDEVTVMSKLDELEAALGANGENLPAIITEIKNIIKLRSIKVANNKRGSY